MKPRALVQNQNMKGAGGGERKSEGRGVNRACQTSHVSKEIWFVRDNYQNSIWRASNYKGDNLHQDNLLKIYGLRVTTREVTSTKIISFQGYAFQIPWCIRYRFSDILVGWLVSWYFEPSQPQRITSRPKTMFHLSPYLLSTQVIKPQLIQTHTHTKTKQPTKLTNKKINPDKQIHKYQTQNLRRISPFGIAPVEIKGT